jgi:hypothetical protein
MIRGLAVKFLAISMLGRLAVVLAVGVGCGRQTPGIPLGGGGASGNGGGGGARDAGRDSSETTTPDARADLSTGDRARGGTGGAATGVAGGGGNTGGSSGAAGGGARGGTGGGRCAFYQFQPSHPTSDEIVADIDKNGRLDVVAVWNEASRSHFLIYRQTGPRVFADPDEYLFDVLTFNRLAVYDLDQDGVLDIAASNDGASVGLMLSSGGSGYAPAPALRPPTNEQMFDVVLADFDGDGYGDIVVPLDNGNTSLGIYWGTGGGAFATRADQIICSNGAHAQVIDANEDGRPDLAVSCLNSGSRVLINQGGRKFSNSLLSGSTQAFGLATGDLNHDGHVDVVVPDLVFKQLLVYLGDGQGNFAVPTGLVASTSSDPRAAAMGDLDGDGNADLVLTDAVQTTIAFYHGTGDGHFQVVQQIPMSSPTANLAIGDIDGDGFQDLMIGNGPIILYGPCP